MPKDDRRPGASGSEGAEAWFRWRAGDQNLSRGELAAAVRHTLALLEERIPGRSVEVRVAPYGAVQVLDGTSHRRGTPPAVVEMDAATWLGLAEGSSSWDEAEEAGRLSASGERSDLSAYLPL